MPVMCGKEAHFGSFYFCQDCAKRGLDISIVFCCSDCHLMKKNMHRTHNDLMLLSSNKFTEPLTQLRSAIHRQLQEIRLKFQRKNPDPVAFSQTVTTLQTQKQLIMLKLIDQKERLSALLIDQNIIRWLMEVKFWQGRNRNTIVTFQNKIKSNVAEKMKANQQFKKIIDEEDSSSQEEEEIFKVDWPDNNVGDIVDKQIEAVNVQNAYRRKEADVCGLVIRLFTAFNSEQLYETESDCQDLLEKYPDSKVLYLSLIRINQLLPDGNRQIPKILQNIIKNVDKNFEASDMFHYYMAMSHWELIQKEEGGSEMLWFELKNKRYYRLIKPDGYIASLNKAIAIRQKPAYYISLGIGYMVKENYQEALNVFKQASSMLTRRNDALDLNRFWASIKFDSSELEFDSIMESLETRTLQFITNICKYFKNSKNYSQLVQCCQELIAREPQRFNLKIHFIKSILSYSSTVNDFNHEDHERLSRADRMIEELKIAQDKEASKLQKRLTRVKAQNEFKNQNLMKASEGFQALTKNTRLTSGSDYYNYAATQFKLFAESQYSDQLLIKQAYQSIKKALSLKPQKIKYKKLKFFACVYMNLFDEAFHTYRELKRVSPEEISDREYDRLIQYVKDNMEEQFTPMGV